MSHGRGAPARDERRLELALAAVLLGLPVWWVLGVIGLVPLFAAAGLAVHLLRRSGPLHLPPGSTWWFLFLVWVVLGVFVLGVDAPGAAPGGDGPGRLLVFGYRLAWYLTCTVALVWLGNTSRRTLPDRSVHAVVAVVCVVTTAGGLLGLLAPQLEFTSALEAVLPRGLRSNSFVAALVHPEAADVQMALGRPETRPKAPFAFTNTWGSVMALSAVFAVAWALTGGRRAKILVAALLAVATVPVVFSLNRGLWACVALGAVGCVLLGLRTRQAGRVLAGAGVVLAVLVLAAGPLLSLVNERLDNPHSNERRGQLAGATMESVSQGSPILGFGTTRDVQGSFASISGGSTPDCPACGVPPLGTQGHFWMVLFSQGWIGLTLFGGFLLSALARAWRCRTVNETVATFCLAFFALQVFVYDTLGLPLLLVFLAMGLLWREHREAGVQSAPWTTPQLAERVRRGAPMAAALTVLGAGVGGASLVSAGPAPWTTEVRMVLSTPTDPYAPAVLGEVLGERLAARRDIPVTIDTEAALLLSEQALTDAQELLQAKADTAAPAVSTAQLRAGVRISAEPNTKILVIDVTGPSASDSRDRAQAMAHAYLGARQRYLDERRTNLLTRLDRDLVQVRPNGPATTTLLLRLNAADRRLRADTGAVGRVITTGTPQQVPATAELRTSSGAALGLLVGVAFGPGPRLRRLRRPSPGPARPGSRRNRPLRAHAAGGER